MTPAPYFEGNQRLLFSCLQWREINEHSLVIRWAHRNWYVEELCRLEGHPPTTQRITHWLCVT